MPEIELNADMGEGYGVWALPSMLWAAELDRGGPLQPAADTPVPDVVQVMHAVSTINLACGFHGGDPLLMKRYIAEAKKAGCSVGAHPSYPDLAGFGLRYMDMTKEELMACIQYQLAAVDGLLRMEGMELHHVKFHGALYNRAVKDPEVAAAAAEGVARYNPDLPLYGFPFSCLEDAANAISLPFVREGFSDRAYHADGRLVDRRRPDAMVLDPKEVAARVIRMVQEGVVRSIEGADVRIDPQTVCFHADTPPVIAFLEHSLGAMKAGGWSVAGR
ncbi:UPF0271 protein [Azorhizobium oxalatiphilum]|uniref:UPF0271 protein n=1 Tax=Azorhizobium oxalatiphilum TaxID=980631 RepID=A0A917CF99_9HYPH|nr:5-oxoprolinase subunit PxpA [Azorhizobium oxalatiphilum]GGF86703.1 UPF0271 protein [Azorhizobium oxalatiphilum]